jgi:type IX secretion system PorP/SprF family membrane protein
MKKYIILLTLIMGINGYLFSQQEPNYTLYMMNPIVYNPAIAGTANYYQIRTNHRFQWTGFKDAPITNSFSAYGPHTKKDMGFGGSIYNDITGPTSRTAINALYAYNISVQRDIRVSFGLNLGLMQYKIDGTKIETYTAKEYTISDPSLLSTVYSSMVPDASAGVYVYSPSIGFYGGFSALHLLDIFSKDPERNIDGINILSTHLYLIGGYMYQIDREWMVEPCMVVKKVIPASYQFELSTKVIYKKMLWGGLAFRTNDAFSVVLGYTYEKKIYFGYAFDLAVNEIRRYSSGSHELVLGYNFTKIKKTSSKKKKR